MVRIDKNITINQPIEVVWNYLTNLENMPQWDRDVLEARKISDGPVGEGTSFEIVDLLMGKRKATLNITEFDPYNRFVIEMHAEIVQGTLRFTLEPNHTGTKLREISYMSLFGLAKILEPVLSTVGKKFSEGDFRKLKSVLETTQ